MICKYSVLQELLRMNMDNFRKKFRSEQQDYKDKLARLEQADEAYYITASLLLDLASRSYELFIGSEPDDKREINN